MNIGILGTGAVGEAIATALVKNGHEVLMGSRTRGNEKAVAWTKKTGKGAYEGAFDEAAGFAEVLFICLNGAYAVEVLQAITPENLVEKIVIDLTNPLDFSQGMPPRLIERYSNGTSLGEELQKTLPRSYVVKTLNTVNYSLMVDARQVNGGDHNLFICGNDIHAKNQVKHLLVDNFHWKAHQLLDLGGIEAARCVEAIVPFWVQVYNTLGTPLFNFKIVH